MLGGVIVKYWLAATLVPIATKKSAAPRGISKQHKAAIVVGREESRAVRRYLDALDANRPKRGRKRTTESIEKRLAAIEDALEAADKLTGLGLVQERMDLHNELAFIAAREDLSEVEAEFVQVAANYSDHRGISYAAWREIGVEPAVLKRAGISRPS